MNKKDILFIVCVLLFVPGRALCAPISISELPSEIIGGEYLLQVENAETLTLSGTTSVSGRASLEIVNYGTIVIDDFSLFTYGAITSFTNYGTVVGDNWKVKDQEDDTSIVNHGSVDIGSLMLTANGGLSLIEYQTLGASAFGFFGADANYGGLINISILEGGSIVTAELSLDASGASHGRESQVNLLQGEIKVEPVPEPATLLLVGSGFLGLLGLRRSTAC